jgi:cytidylate kinase
VSRRLAERLCLPHLDTGAFYRAATLAVLRAGTDVADGEQVMMALGGAEFDQREGVMFLDGGDVGPAIRTEEVTSAVSAVSAHPEVRERMVGLQRGWVERNGGSAVVEGRDIGSVVFPDADLKVFLTASAEERARRRAQETEADERAIAADLVRRDRHDSTRAASPLVAAEGAVVVDTTDMTIDEVVERLLDELDARGVSVR